MTAMEETISNARAMGIDVDTDVDGAPCAADGMEVIGGRYLLYDVEHGELGLAARYLPVELYLLGPDAWTEEGDLVEVEADYGELTCWAGGPEPWNEYEVRGRPGDRDMYERVSEAELEAARERALEEAHEKAMLLPYRPLTAAERARRLELAREREAA